jgi:hypothetical protein
MKLTEVSPREAAPKPDFVYSPTKSIPVQFAVVT